MSQPFQPQMMISGCYDELLEDLSLLHLLSKDEWISIQELPYLGALHFCIVWEELFSQMDSLELWG